MFGLSSQGPQQPLSSAFDFEISYDVVMTCTRHFISTSIVHHGEGAIPEGLIVLSI